MANSIQFAVVQKELAGPTADQLKKAFKSFSNWTDADAVRLAVGARGILMNHLGQDAARALQTAFQAEGIGVMIVAENDLPKLPLCQSLHRVDLWPQAFVVYDPFGRPTEIAWQKITLVAAGAAQNFEINKTHTEFIRSQLSAVSGVRHKGKDQTGRKIEAKSQLLLEILLAQSAIRYQIDAAHFTFKHVIDRPGLSMEETFVWLVREICRNAPQAVLNAGARTLCQGRQVVPAYTNRQVFMDEMVWLLWRSEHQKRLLAS
jgi:hypothetical protein